MSTLRTNGEAVSVPYHLFYDRLCDDEETQRYRFRRPSHLHKRSIRSYRHATTKWGAALESFSPMWFAICISSGGLGLILNSPFPYQGQWLVTLSSILYVVDLVLFLLFMGILLARWIVYPHVAIRRAWARPDELAAYAIAPIALLTLSGLTASQVSEASWGGHSFTLVAFVCWWIAVVWVFATVLVLFSVLFFNGNQNDRIMSPLILMAPVGLATAGAEAATITIRSADMSARLAVPQLVVAYFSVGLAMFVAISLYTIYFHKLLSAGWPPAAKRAGLFILIGPCGQLSTALQLLGESASGYMRFPDYKPGSYHPPDIGTLWRPETASALDGAGVLLALLLIGFGYFWFSIATIGVVDVLVRKQASYSLVWWSLVFPCVTFTTAWLGLSKSMDSPAFRVLTSIMTVLITIAYLGNWIFTIRGLLTGKLIFGPSQVEIEDELIKRAEEESAGHNLKIS